VAAPVAGPAAGGNAAPEAPAPEAGAAGVANGNGAAGR